MPRCLTVCVMLALTACLLGGCGGDLGLLDFRDVTYTVAITPYDGAELETTRVNYTLASGEVGRTGAVALPWGIVVPDCHTHQTLILRVIGHTVGATGRLAISVSISTVDADGHQITLLSEVADQRAGPFDRRWMTRIP